jgi:predicted RNase H-like HicB family nuclease
VRTTSRRFVCCRYGSEVCGRGRKRRIPLLASPYVETRRFGVLLEWDPTTRVWVTFVPSLDSLSTYGNTREAALEQTREAILGYFEAAAKEGLPVPEADLEPEVVELEVATP